MKEKKIPKYLGPDTSGRKRLMSKEEIKSRFDNESAALYSRRDPAWLPDFRYAFGLIPELIRAFAPGAVKILDLGAGTGNLSRVILANLESAQVRLMDFSANMLAEAPKVLEAFPGRYEIVTSDFLGRALGSGEFDAVVSSFAIHHCRGEGQYLDLYKRIFDCLIQPGIFICCDVVSGENPFFSEYNENEWRTFLDERDFPSEQIDKILSNYHIEDSPLSIPNHLTLLKQAGFSRSDVVWKRANFAVYAGIVEKENPR